MAVIDNLVGAQKNISLRPKMKNKQITTVVGEKKFRQKVHNNDNWSVKTAEN